jgi:hypothetical protein
MAWLGVWYVSAGLCYLQCSRSACVANDKTQRRCTAYSPNSASSKSIFVAGLDIVSRPWTVREAVVVADRKAVM